MLSEMSGAVGYQMVGPFLSFFLSVADRLRSFRLNVFDTIRL
jgi:hypothetical protein